MSGETGDVMSGWTTDTVLSHLEQKIVDLRRALDERYETQTKSVDKAFEAQQTAMQTAFTAADAAVNKALAAAEKAVDQRATTLDREFHEHLEQVRHENALAQVNSDKAVTAALASAKEAVNKAESYADERFKSVNEFRAQLADQAGTFVSRAEAEANRLTAEAKLQSLSGDLDKLEKRMDLSQGQQSGAGEATEHRRAQNAQVIAIVSAVLFAVSVAVAVILGFNS